MTLAEFTFDEFCRLPMETIFHATLEKQYVTLKANGETGVSVITITNRIGECDLGESTSTYTFNKIAYETADQVYLAYMNYVCTVKKSWQITRSYCI